MPALLLQIGLGFAIGLALGLLGGGGSILTVPALVYLVGQPPHGAVTTALAIVAGNSMLGAAAHRRQGTLNWRVALLFGGAGMGVAYLAAGLSRGVPPAALLVLFAALMLAIGVLMLSRPAGLERRRVARDCNWLVVLGSGASVGLLTGFLGVGGGFLIVPALVLLVGLPMAEAVGTSLLVIAMNSLAGLMGHLGGSALDGPLTAVFVVAGLGGTLLGARLAGQLPARQLRRAFGVFVIVLAVFLLLDNLPKLLG